MAEILIPEPIQKALANGADIILSVSGGKDSDAMTWAIIQAHQAHGWTGKMLLVHADLGRSEWHSTPAYVRSLAERTGLKLYVVRHSLRELLDEVKRKLADDPTTCPWPSSTARYCTSDFKTSPVNRFINNAYERNTTVICALGLRADESPARAKKPIYRLRAKVQAPTKHRVVWDWNPIHHWTIQDVWHTIKTLGDGIRHPAYNLGNERLSCALCILGSTGDLLNGIEHNQAIYREYVQIEAESGFSFKGNQWLADLRPDLLDAQTLATIARHKANRPAKVSRKTLAMADVPCSA